MSSCKIFYTKSFREIEWFPTKAKPTIFPNWVISRKNFGKLKKCKGSSSNFTSYIKRIYTTGFVMIPGGIEVN